MVSSSSAHRSACRRSGLTLLELVVVMAILVAAAGVLIPMITGMIGRAETSSRATNSGEIFKWLQTYEATYTRFPYDFDSLLNSSGQPFGTGATPAASYVGGFTASGGQGPALLPATLDSVATVNITGAQLAAALTGVGITRLQFMNDAATGTNITFSPYVTSNPIDKTVGTGDGYAVSATSNLATLTPYGQVQLNLADNQATATGNGYVYVVFGFGARTSIVGEGTGNAPVNFFDNAALSPDTRYERYGVVFQLSGPDNTGSGNAIAFGRARLCAVFRFGGNPASGTGENAIQGYWSDVTGVNGS